MDVIATVTESGGTPTHNGTLVTFVGSFGRFEPAEATTSGGRAVVKFIGTSSGTTKITAISGGIKAESGDVKVGGAAAATIAVRAEPPTVPQNGGSVQAIALVGDASGNPLPGVNVVFTTDNGSLANSSVLTDADGIARTTLTTNRVSRITATVADKTGTVIVNVVTAPTVTIVATTANPVAGSPVAFTVTPASATTANPIQSVVVDFGDGRSQTLNGITGPFGLTHIYRDPGGYTVRATATDVTGVQGVSSTAVVVGFAPVPTVTLSVNPNPIPPASNGFATITVGATAGGGGGAPIRSVVVEIVNGPVIYSSTGGGSFTYQFGSFGGNTVTLRATATDANGQIATTTTVVVVQ